MTKQKITDLAQKICNAYQNISDISSQELMFEIDPAPHEPGSLPKGKMAVYCFILKNCCLKVGKAGPKSKARYNSDHYCVYPNTSTLAKSIINDKTKLKKFFPKDMHDKIDALDKSNISDWLISNTDRINFLLDSSRPIKYLNLLKATAQFFLEPIYEGRD